MNYIFSFLEVNLNILSSFSDIQWFPWTFDICIKMRSTENLDLPISSELPASLYPLYDDDHDLDDDVVT